MEESSKERSERCGRITADVTKKAIEIINAKIEKGKDWKGAFPKQQSGCLLRRMPRFGQASRYSEGQNGLYALPQRQRTPDEQVQRSSLKSVFRCLRGSREPVCVPRFSHTSFGASSDAPIKKGMCDPANADAMPFSPCASTQQTLVFMYPAQ